MPKISADGKTYTFRIRKGYRFSPPSNEEVTAQTFKYSIERALSAKLGPEAPGISVLGDVVGAHAFHDGKAEHVSGIVVRGNTLTFHLTDAHGDFVSRLALPYFSAVPIDTPIVNGGVQTPIPSAGPYYLKQDFLGELKILLRNPNYTGPRPHKLERFVYRVGESNALASDKIVAGDVDYTADILREASFKPGGPLDTRYGSNKRMAGSPRLVQTPVLGLHFIQFNTSRGPFATVRLRRAVNYALDRRALASALGEMPTDAYVPAGTPGAAQVRVYPDTPNLSRARALAGGFHGAVSLYTCKEQDCRARARLIRGSLAPLGITVKIKAFDDPYAPAEAAGSRYDMLDAGWYLDWPEPSAMLNGLLTSGGYRPSWLPPPLEIPSSYSRRLDNAGRLTGRARESAYARLQIDVERHVVPFAVYSQARIPEFFSARMGCLLTNPVMGAVDLGALCVAKS